VCDVAAAQATFPFAIELDPGFPIWQVVGPRGRRNFAPSPGGGNAMSDAPDLERRYQRLLRFFPARYRREHEQEILSVLMAGAKDGQQRPGLADSADLLISAIFMRWREMTRQPRWKWERRHWRLIVRLRVTIGIWLLVVGAILVGKGYWWGVVMVAPAALHFYLAYRLRHAVQS
jgi:hypothetical protein